jgi:hypothetical protein
MLWMHIVVNSANNAVLAFGKGAAGFEVTFFDESILAGTGWDICTAPFSIPAGTRISCNPTANIAVVEFHLFY